MFTDIALNDTVLADKVRYKLRFIESVVGKVNVKKSKYDERGPLASSYDTSDPGRQPKTKARCALHNTVVSLQ